MFDKYRNGLSNIGLKHPNIYSVDVNNITFKSTLVFTDEVISLLNSLFDGHILNSSEYDLLDRYGLVGNRRRRDKHCTPCDVRAEYIMFFCKTKKTDFHKGKSGFMCTWCAQQRADFIGLDGGFISIDYSLIQPDSLGVTEDNFSTLALDMGKVLSDKKGGF